MLTCSTRSPPWTTRFSNVTFFTYPPLPLEDLILTATFFQPGHIPPRLPQPRPRKDCTPLMVTFSIPPAMPDPIDIGVRQVRFSIRTFLVGIPIATPPAYLPEFSAMQSSPTSTLTLRTTTPTQLSGSIPSTLAPVPRRREFSKRTSVQKRGWNVQNGLFWRVISFMVKPEVK